MRKHTKTKDEQDVNNPYKPFPDKPYFEALHQAWMNESVLFVEKSRTMMATWWAAGESLHMAMNRPATKVLMMAQDEDRSLKALDYAWTLYENQDDELKYLWPLDRPRDKQAYNILELRNASSLVALPGKDPDKIRSEHPTVVVFDEACYIDRFAEAFDIAIATRALKIVAISSADQGDFCDITSIAESIEWPYAA